MGIAEAEAWIAENAGRGFATLCVAPTLVASAARLLRGQQHEGLLRVRLPARVLAHRHQGGRGASARRRSAARKSTWSCALGDLLADDDAYVREDIDAVVEAVVAESGGEALVKVILETGYLAEEQVTLACLLAEEAGADFVKTSTGFGPRGASVRDVELMSAAVGGRLGIKAAGGIRELDSALALIEAGATRLGTSAGEHLLDELAERGE